jgi:hypothetical protein
LSISERRHEWGGGKTAAAVTLPIASDALRAMVARRPVQAVRILGWLSANCRTSQLFKLRKRMFGTDFSVMRAF